MFTKIFWKDASERAISTAAQFLLVLGGADGANFLSLDSKQVVLLSLAGAFAAVLKAIVALKTTSGNSASLTIENVKEK